MKKNAKTLARTLVMVFFVTFAVESALRAEQNGTTPPRSPSEAVSTTSENLSPGQLRLTKEDNERSNTELLSKIPLNTQKLTIRAGFDIARLPDILKRTPQLKRLTVYGGIITSEALKSLPSSVMSLRLNGATLEDAHIIKKIAEQCPRLEMLGLHGCKMPPEGFESIADLKTLNTLDVSNTPVTKNTIEWIIQESSNLRDLNLSETAADDSTLQHTALHRPELEILSIGGTTNITAPGLINALKNLEELIRLDLVATTLSKKELKDILKYLPRLQYLDLSENHQVDDDLLSILAKGGERLTILTLYGCPKITTKGIEKFQKIRNDNDMPECNLYFIKKDLRKNLTLQKKGSGFYSFFKKLFQRKTQTKPAPSKN